ncbi:unnamed protein product [Caenorhabditis sp. 36 PRJEB53466]|nr:unnamed protein product [Caenorhabditis sp. 36 PRJEB53466]
MEEQYQGIVKYLLSHYFLDYTVNSIVSASEDEGMNLQKLALNTFLKQELAQKEAKKYPYLTIFLRLSQFNDFIPFMNKNSPKSVLFYLKYCFMSGVIRIIITKQTLKMSNLNGYFDVRDFLELNHSKKEGYSMKTITKFLKIIADKRTWEIVVIIDDDVEKDTKFRRQLDINDKISHYEDVHPFTSYETKFIHLRIMNQHRYY